MTNHRPSFVNAKRADDAYQGDCTCEDEGDAFAQLAEDEPQTESVKHPTYGQMCVQKTLGVYFAKPYSLAACSAGMMKLRLGLLFLLVTAGIVGLVSFGHAGALSVSPVWGMCGFLCSVGCLLWGMGTFLFGFARASLIWPIGTALYLLWTGAHLALLWAWGRSPALFAALGAFLLALAVGAVGQMVKRLVLSFAATFWQYERGGVLHGADLPLGELPPVKGYPFFLCGAVHAPVADEEEPATAINGILHDYLYDCVRRRLILCGYALDAHDQQLTFYLYADDVKRAKRAFTRFMRKRGHPAVVHYQSDAEWRQFHAEVYPNETEYQQIHNRFLYDNMEKDGFDFLQAVPQVYTFYFSREEDARIFAEQGGSLGYEYARYVDRTQGVRAMGDDPAYAYVVYTQLTGRVGLARMDCNTDRAVELAEQFHGRFHEWEIGRLPQDFRAETKPV